MQVNKKFLIFTLQKYLLIVSYNFFSLISTKSKKNIEWVIGVDEMASMLYFLAKSINKSYSVNCLKHVFYSDVKYDYSMYKKRNIIGPILLGKLLNKSKGFIYIWSTGFLDNSFDNREFEFNYIQKKSVKLFAISVVVT